MRQFETETLSQEDRLFLGLAEQLAQPLTAISRISEISGQNGSTQDWQLVHAVANASLRLVESYALSLRVNGRVTPLQLEPVTISSLLYDATERLAPLAKQYGVTLELDTGPRVQPVLADRTVLQSAFESLGQVFVTASAEAEDRALVRLSAHRSRYGVVAGLYGGTEDLGADSLRRARVVQGVARQPLQQATGDSAAGVFVAEHLLKALETKLHVARYHRMSGLAATLQPSQQLQFI